ncbi:MAG: site-specific DNA-methyltransferase [Deltaproteobacteria bacterium]|nr:site-specific DNA-methyltransferase [Deltaproteobacteria bacterium]
MITDYLNRIICGDALETMKRLPKGSIDLIVTSPPYNIRRIGAVMKRFRNKKERSGIYPFNSMDYKKAFIFNGYDIHDDNMPYPAYARWQRSCIRQMLKLIKPSGAIFYNHKFRIQNGLLNDRSDILKGFPVRQMIIWDKGGSVNFNDTYFLPSYEVIYLIAGPDFKLAPKANSNRDVWYIYPQKGSEHPAPFPEALSDKIISSTTADIILDPFMGSGTTAVSALKCGRNYIGIDNSQKYCEMAEERIKEYLR